MDSGANVDTTSNDDPRTARRIREGWDMERDPVGIEFRYVEARATQLRDLQDRVMFPWCNPVER